MSVFSKKVSPLHENGGRKSLLRDFFVGLLKNYVAESENMCYNNKMQNLHTVQMAAIHFFKGERMTFDAISILK